MEIIRLKPPRPWGRPRRARVWDFGAFGILRAPKVRQRKLGSIEMALETRQSRREFTAPLTLQQLGDLLWHSYRVRQKARITEDSLWESRPSPSGGGCYPVQVLVLRLSALPGALLLYYPEDRAFGVRDLPVRGVLRRSLAEIGRCLKTRNGTILWFLADLGRSAWRYQNPESLAWRDSGALLATIGLVAEGMGLNCCGLGAHDIPSLRRFLGLEDWIIGVGGCI